MSVRHTAPVSGDLSTLFPQTPVEVLCDRTPGTRGMRRTKDAERLDALGGRTSQLVGDVAVFEQMAVVDRRSGGHMDEAVSRTNGA